MDYKHKILEIVEEYKEELGDGKYLDICNILVDKYNTKNIEELENENKRLESKNNSLENENKRLESNIKSLKNQLVQWKLYLHRVTMRIFSGCKNGLGNTYRDKILKMFEPDFDERKLNGFGRGNFKSWARGWCITIDDIKYTTEWSEYPVLKLDYPKEYYKNNK